MAARGPRRDALSCGNLAHAFAACTPSEKAALAGNKTLNLGIVTSYNDMLSAHQPFVDYPPVLKKAAVRAGGRWVVTRRTYCDVAGQGQTQIPEPCR